jgi:hypothetical protein
MKLDANTTVENLIGVFLPIEDGYHLRTLMEATENTIKENHKDIIAFLDGKIDKTVLDDLKKELKL